MIYVVERLEDGKWVYVRDARGPMNFTTKRAAEAVCRRLGPGHRVRKIID